MEAIKPRYSKEEFARRGEEIFENQIRPQLGDITAMKTKFILIDIDTGAYEIDADEIAASDRLRARHPKAQIWIRRVGSPYAYHFGGRYRSVTS